MAKLVDPRKVALETLAASIADPNPKLLYQSGSSPGFFKGKAAGTKRAAEVCLQENWLEPSGTLGKGKDVFRLSPKGIQAVLENNPTTAVLEGIQSSMDQQKEQLKAFGKMLQAMESKVERVSELVEDVAHKVKPQIVETSASNGHVPLQQLEAEILRQVGHRTRDAFMPLPELFRLLRATWPSLSIGEFHDRLRHLRETNGIQFAPYTRSFAVIARDREAMFWDGEVMYYAYGA